MLPDHWQWIGVQFEPEGDPWPLFEIARRLEEEGNLEGAATVYNRAFGIDPTAAKIRARRQEVLDRLAVVEHGLVFRYIPAGMFLMGCDESEPDERPLHPVWLDAYWMSETPISWEAYCRLLDWEPPPNGYPREFNTPPGAFNPQRFHLHESNKIRLQYCEDHTTCAWGWHSHIPPEMRGIAGHIVLPPRDEPDAPWRYAQKPLVAAGWQEAEELANHLSDDRVKFCLPTEAQWEKAARGGLIGARYAWGDEPPTHDRCDFNRFYETSIQRTTTFPPNDYGLYAMCGGVWEWTGDNYDSDYYRVMPDENPPGAVAGTERVLRGGSWADCAEAVTVTFRTARASSTWRDGEWGRHLSPNIGFRLCRIVPRS